MSFNFTQTKDKFLVKNIFFLVFLCCSLLLSSCKQSKQEYDVVIKNAQVIDPESHTNSILTVGITGDKITYIGTERIKGKKEIDGKGMVLSPGFIDVHAHG